jgi:hypothetical protein
MVNGFMEKKVYSIPAVEVMTVSTVLMQKTGEASLLPGPGSAPKRPVIPTSPVLPLDSVAVF